MVPWARQGHKRQPGNNPELINILQAYAQTPSDIELFTVDSNTPLSYLQYSELLTAFPSGNVPRAFELKSLQWQLKSAVAPGSKSLVHLAVLTPATYNSTPGCSLPAAAGSPASDSNVLFGLQQDSKSTPNNRTGQPNSQIRPVHSKQYPRSMTNSQPDNRPQLLLQDGEDDVSQNDGEISSLRHAMSDSGCYLNSSPVDGCYNGSGYSRQLHQQQHQQQHQQRLAVENRKFTRNLLSANNKMETLDRYKAIIALIESCKRRLETQIAPGVSPADFDWSSGSCASLIQAVIDVGEALVSFGNCRFPEQSNETRAILAADYKALLRKYLSQFGFVFAAQMKEQLSHDLQEEVQSVGSLLATRCEAYNLLYDQLVRHVGLEGRGGPSTVVFNHNTASANPNTTITANPTNTTTASSVSKSKAVNKGIGAAAIAAAGLAAVLLAKALRGGGGRGGGGKGKSQRGSSSDGSSSLAQQQRQLRIPKGKNGRELMLVTQLSACGDELRRAKQNDELLKDDWRLGRHVRLAWPPGPPVPAGYTDLAPDACNVSQLLQEMYG